MSKILDASVSHINIPNCLYASACTGDESRSRGYVKRVRQEAMDSHYQLGSEDNFESPNRNVEFKQHRLCVEGCESLLLFKL